jgi:DNA-binding beta-propeller fold protein YncE
MELMEHIMRVGSGKFVFEEVKDWAQLPPGMKFGECPGVAVDSQDRVYVLSRSENPVTVFDRDGHYLGAWGQGTFRRPHHVLIGPDDSVYIVDDKGHTVYKFTTDGKLLMKIDKSDHPADTGYQPGVRGSVVRAGPPFNLPTGLALASDGSFYVSDGYGNARVHKFTADGKLLFSWGEPGTGAGEFDTPHGVCVDKEGQVYVSDRLNHRIQVFDPNGQYITAWTDVDWPDNMCIDAEGNAYVAEVGCIYLQTQGPDYNQPPARITVRDLKGRILTDWCEPDPYGKGQYYAPHGIALDSRGNLHVSEVSISYTHGAAPADWPVLRKYIRV